MGQEIEVGGYWDFHVAGIIELWERCALCGEGIFGLNISEVTDAGLIQYHEEYEDTDSWVEGIVVCPCGTKNEVIRVM